MKICYSVAVDMLRLFAERAYYDSLGYMHDYSANKARAWAYDQVNILTRDEVISWTKEIITGNSVIVYGLTEKLELFDSLGLGLNQDI